MDMWLSWLLRSRDLAPLDNLMSSISFSLIQLSMGSLNDPAAATQWIKSSSLPEEAKTQLLPR